MGIVRKNDISRMAGLLIIITAIGLVLNEFVISPYLMPRAIPVNTKDNYDQDGNNVSDSIIDFDIKISDTQTVAPPPLPLDSLPARGRKCC